MTTDYYDQNARAYFDSTVDVDMEPLCERFLRRIPPGVTAMDASAEMARLASAYTGLQVQNLRFEEMNFTSAFDGIWATASLLHVPRTSMHGVFERLIAALKPGGICYMSFKLGDRARTEGGRYFNDQNEETLSKALSCFPDISIDMDDQGGARIEPSSPG